LLEIADNVQQDAVLRSETREQSSAAAGDFFLDVAARKRAPHAVIIVENMTVPPDRRVWQQARSLVNDGWRVSVISPKMGAYQKSRETIDGVNIVRHPLAIEARGIAAYAVEYLSAIVFEAISILALGVDDIDVVQICNPPDFLFLPALIAKKFGKAKVVFDHHDLTPELLSLKLGNGRGSRFLLPFARWAQRQTFRVADAVVSTNSTFHRLALEEGGKCSNEVSTVYSGPELSRIGDARANPQLKMGKEVLLLWVGVMGSQDGLIELAEALDALRRMPGGDKFHLLIAGDGPERDAAEKKFASLGLSEIVTFAGFLYGSALAEAFATADIGVGSDPKNDFNDRLAMNKVMEYMAYSLPMALFDLMECRRIAGSAALFAPSNDPRALAAALSNLIENPQLRTSKGATGRLRLESTYCWEKQEAAYLDVYRRLLDDA
jgi:glycosyltransferase involved in cell wall biosynthesis